MADETKHAATTTADGVAVLVLWAIKAYGLDIADSDLAADRRRK